MKALNISIDKKGKTKRQAFVDGLRQAIRSGQIKPGEKLPSSREFAKQLSIHRQTVMAALSELESEGWIQSQEKMFYQINETLPDTFLQPKLKTVHAKISPSKMIQFARLTTLQDYTPISNFKHSFPSGFPDLRLFPMTEFKSHIYDAIKSIDALMYGDPSGHHKLIEEVSNYLRRVRGVNDRKIVITNGSQEAFFLIAQSLISIGDLIAVEALVYPNALEAFKYAGAKFIPIPVDQEGMNIDDLENKFKKSKIKFIYITPLHQYPTTVTLSASRRLKLYDIALKYGALIIEDDYDHEFHYIGQPTAPLASFDPAGIILYVSTFSKILFPSARVGFMAVPLTIAKEIAKLKMISSRQNEQIMQLAISYWMKSGGFEKHLRKMRRTYAERRDSVIRDLHYYKQIYPQISWANPDGGMALWLSVGENSSKLANQLKKHSILVNPEQIFRCDGLPGTHLRIGFTGYTEQENRTSLDALFRFIK